MRSYNHWLINLLKNLAMKHSLRYIIILVVLAALTLICISFTSVKQNHKMVGKVIVNIRESFGQFFITRQEIELLINEGADQQVLGSEQMEINLKSVESSIESHKFVKNAEVYRDLKGNLIVDVNQRRPLARIVQSKGPHAYIGFDGHILPIIKSYTARVNLIGGDYAAELLKKDLHTTNYGKKLLEFLKFIEQDKFWKAQLAQINIDRKGNLSFQTQVSKQIVEFGQPEDYEFKLKKLKVFYTRILPESGWNTYERVNVVYSNQIICE